MRWTVHIGVAVLMLAFAGCSSRSQVDQRVLDRKGIQRGSATHQVMESDLKRIENVARY